MTRKCRCSRREVPRRPSGQFDQATLELGNNLLVYTTEPLRQPLRVFGYPRILLYCASSSAHTDFTAKLVRVRPNGVAEFICIGIARSSRLFAETGYAADKIHLWHFLLEPTSCRFDAGDRIRLEIASSAFPLYDRNPGTASAFLPRHFLGLATLDANRLSRSCLRVGAVFALKWGS